MTEQLSHIQELIESRASKSSRLIAIASGKGGVGKSNLAVNLGIAIARQNKRVIVVDADTNLANIDVLFGLSPKNTLLNYVLDNYPLKDILIHHESGVDILPNASGSPVWHNIDDSIKASFYRLLFQLQRSYDFVLMDTAPGLSPLTIDLLCQVDENIIVTTPEPPAISDAYALIKIMNSIKKDIKVNLLLNMVYSVAEVADVYQRFSLVLKHFLGVSIGIIGYITHDEHVRMAVKKQEPLVLAFPESTAASDIQNVATTVLANKEFINDLVAFY